MNNTNTSSKQIIGGIPTVPGRYLYQVILNLNDDTVYCSGSVISPNIILSAAHCSGLSHVVIGAYDVSNVNETGREVREVAFEMSHPGYDSWTLNNDVMLLYLKEETSFQPVTLDDGTTDLSDGVDVSVSGWGRTGTSYYGGGPSDTLLEVEVDIVSNEKCNAASSYNGDVDKDTMICASREEKGWCEGDGGGPLIIKGDDATSDVQVGIASWGYGCADPSFPGVYTNVGFFNKFITDGLTCRFGLGMDASSFESCNSVECRNGVFTCRGPFSWLFPGLRRLLTTFFLMLFGDN